MPRPSNAYVRDCCQDASRLNQLTVVISCNLPASREKNLFQVPVDIRRRLSMDPSQVLLLAFLIGVVAGLRSLTAPAAVAWAAHRNWINLHNTALSFMGGSEEHTSELQSRQYLVCRLLLEKKNMHS